MSLKITIKLSASVVINTAYLSCKIGRHSYLILIITLVKWITPHFLVVEVNPLRSETKTVTSYSSKDFEIKLFVSLVCLFLKYKYVNSPNVLKVFIFS